MFQWEHPFLLMTRQPHLFIRVAIFDVNYFMKPYIVLDEGNGELIYVIVSSITQFYKFESDWHIKLIDGKTIVTPVNVLELIDKLYEER